MNLKNQNNIHLLQKHFGTGACVCVCVWNKQLFPHDSQALTACTTVCESYLLDHDDIRAEHFKTPGEEHDVAPAEN